MQATTVSPIAARKRRRRWRLTPRFWLLLVAAFAAYMIYSYSVGFAAIVRLQRTIRGVEQEIEQVAAHNDALRLELEYLQSDEYIEKVAREELGLVMPGETAVIMASPSSTR